MQHDQQPRRRLGLDDLSVPPGSHIVYFYEDKETLLQALVPYFKAGLEDGECCLWVATPALTVEEARGALAAAVPEAAQLIAAGQMTILDPRDWYLKGGRCDGERVLTDWLDREAEALMWGYEGLRASGGPAWVDSKSWRDWIAYERAVDERLSQHPMIALCTYSAREWSTTEIAEAVSSHHYALTRRERRWHLHESPTITQKVKHLEKSLQHLSLVHGLAALAAEERELKPFLGRALAQILKLPVLEPRGAIFLMNRAGTALRLAAEQGLSPPLASTCEQVPLGECLCGRSALVAEAIVADAGSPKAMHSRRIDSPPHSHIILPIKQGKGVLGVLCLYTLPQKLEQLDIEALVDASNQLATGIQRLAHLEELERRTQQLEAVQRIADAIGRPLTASPVARVALKKAMALLGGDCGGVVMPGRGGRGWRTIAHRGISEPLLRQAERFPSADEYPDLPNLENVAATIESLDTDPRLPKPVRHALREEGIRSLAVAPLLLQGKFQGVIAIAFRSQRSLSQEEQALLGIIASQLSIALERAAAHDQVRRQATRDALTGLFNRRHFNGVLKRELGRAKRYDRHFSLILLDINNFKSYNDQYGHLEGDIALRTLAQRVKAATRSTDIPCRYGGDELVVVLPETDKQEATAMAQRIQRAVAARRFPKARLTLSFGVATCPEDGSHPATLIGRADQALYQARQALKNQT